MREVIERAFRESAETKLLFARENGSKISDVAERIAAALRQGGKLLLFGNGGSACDASHLAAEFVNRFRKDRRELPALSLATDMAVLTSISNDYDYSEVFAKQIRALGGKEDIAIAISTSGNSPNVLKGVQAAKEKGLITVGLTGQTGGRLAGLVDYAFLVPSQNTARIQETHITLGHVICELVEADLCGGER